VKERQGKKRRHTAEEPDQHPLSSKQHPYPGFQAPTQSTDSGGETRPILLIFQRIEQLGGGSSRCTCFDIRNDLLKLGEANESLSVEIGVVVPEDVHHGDTGSIFGDKNDGARFQSSGEEI